MGHRFKTGSEIGFSSLLSILPLQDKGFYLHKQEFWDTVHLYYGWELANTCALSYCVCWSHFTADYAMIC